MTPEAEEILSQAVEAQKRSIRAGECPALVILAGERRLTMSDYDYLRDEQAATGFEQRAAAKAAEIHATRWVITVPQVWLIAPGQVSLRAVSNLPLRSGESEAITWMTFDLADGVDYGRVPFTRQPGGETLFADAEVITALAQPAPGMPGYVLLGLTAGGAWPG